LFSKDLVEFFYNFCRTFHSNLFISVRDLPLNIIAETDDLLVVDKPPSLPVHACGQYAIHTVLGQLRVNHNRTGLRVLHRLDRTTSGVLLFAKNYKTDLEFKKTLKDGNWSKEYICMVDGDFPDEEIECNEPIGTLVISMGIQCVRPDGKPARSRFKKIWSDGKRSVVSVNIYTGRTHQIRVHAQFLGYPIVGDRIYNSSVWGPSKGKGAKYEKPYEELCNDVREAHRGSNWHETVDPEYESRMEKMASEELTPEPFDYGSQDRPSYDPICLNCNVVKKKVPHDHFQLFLHCLKYSTEKWSYSTPMPEWAISSNVNSTEQILLQT
ncbi:pseudouridine synthase, RluA family, partial [Ancylostoma caninum]